jgi:O-antigen/teichoic acid export membrane protein
MNNQITFVKNISIYTFGNILIKFSGFLLLPLYSIYLSTEDYGILNSMALFGNILIVIVTMSLDRSIFRCFFDYKTDIERKEFIGTITISLLVLLTVSFILLIVFSTYVSLIFKSISFYPYFVLTIASSFITIFYTIVTSYYQVTEQSKKFILLTISFFFIDVCLTILFVAMFKMGAVGKLFASFIAILIFMPITIIIIKKISTFHFKLKILQGALSYSLPIIPSILSAWVLDLSDRIFIERYCSLSDVGIYSMGYKFAGVLVLLSGGFFTAYTPMFFRIANSDNVVTEKNLLYRINTQFTLIILILTFITFILAKDTMRIFIDSKFFESYKILQFTVLGYFFLVLSDILNLSFAQNKKMVTYMFVNIGGAILNLILNWLLIPKYGMFGAAYSTTISFALLFVVKYNFARNYFFISWAWKKLSLYLLITIILISFSKLIVINNSLNSFIFKFSLVLLIIVFYLIDNKKYLAQLYFIIKSTSKTNI